ncbi:hypothetical protein NDU88_003331 [Pleurodeles waltl]|uniref:Uncharacterized protein n=1 Tax=Pleurodeles waltl TaxID=8319 RepID=A0AAV7REK2_PLEWA|nr:hypothetical protein NDU88_003331 [Pleurodeles waltl]
MLRKTRLHPITLLCMDMLHCFELAPHVYGVVNACIVYYTMRQMNEFCKGGGLPVKKRSTKRDLQKAIYSFEEAYWVKEAEKQEGDDSGDESGEDEDPFAAL